MTMPLRTFVLCILSLCLPLSDAQSQHSREFWRAIAQNNYTVPANESADALAHELSAMLASPDPELRDAVAYSTFYYWIKRDNLSTPTLISLTDEWRANLKRGLGDTGTNSVLNRSFSALCLSEMAKREARSAFMGSERFHSLVSEAVSYLQDERDLRGYDASLHWIHATAHTADLLSALAQGPQLKPEEATTILFAIAGRLSTAPQVYTQGEQDRLAATVVSVLLRPDFDPLIFERWLNRIGGEDRDVWTKTTVESLARFQNHTYMLQALAVRTTLQKDNPRMEQYRDKVLALLAKRLE